jgi:uncharacterized OsmC-like protein
MAVKSVKVHASSPTAAHCRVENDRNQAIEAVFSPSAPGFTPLEIQASALAACIASSVRIAARNLGVGQLGRIDVDVEATKAADEPSRLGTFHAIVRFGDALDPAVKQRLVAAAENICTISNTLRAGDTIVTGEAV